MDKQLQHITDTGNIIVPVIASFDYEGNICPLYVRIQGISYKIDSYYVTSKIPPFSFECTIIDGNFKKYITLIYFYRDTVWVLRKKQMPYIMQ